MKKLKRLFAFMMVMAMTLGMTIMAQAETVSGTKVIVDGVSADAVMKYSQVIVPDQTTTTGWAIVDAYEKAFKNGFKVETEQDAIEKYMSNELAESVKSEVIDSISTDNSFTNGTTFTEPGLYVISVVSDDPEYTYKKIAVFVEMDLATGKAKVETVNKAIKKSKNIVDKVADQTYVEINDEITFTLEAYVPYIPAGSTATFTITDTLSGGEYKLNADSKVEVLVVPGIENANGDIIKCTVVDVADSDDQSIVIDLSSYIDAQNSKANDLLTLKYVVIATGTEVNNTVIPSTPNATSKTVVTYTSPITITKKDAKTKAVLAGAEFIIVKEENKIKSYAKLDTNNVLTGWVTDEAEATKITTVKDGTATAKGFDADDTLYFRETKAPTGYSLNNVDAKVTWAAAAGATNGAKVGTAEMVDTQLSKLPYTGGAGTGIFTALGTVLMSGAGLLYFSTKKKSPK